MQCAPAGAALLILGMNSSPPPCRNIKAFSEHFHSQYKHLHILHNNASEWIRTEPSFTEEGFQVCPRKCMHVGKACGQLLTMHIAGGLPGCWYFAPPEPVGLSSYPKALNCLLQTMIGIQHWGHAYLTLLLLDLLKASAPARIVYTSSASEASGDSSLENIE